MFSWALLILPTQSGGGTLSVSGFTVDNFGKVYRSCGNCDEMYERHVIMDDITATSGSEIAGMLSLPFI